MSDVYRVFGSELSPYSVKVRSYFRYKRIPHDWLIRSAATEEEFQKYAKLPLIPLVVAPDGTAMQDSTPIIETLERTYPDPPVQPADEALAFVSTLIEEYADEWGNKPMFHYRWFYPPDQDSAAERIARSMMPGVAEDAVASAIETIKTRMIPRLAFVGSSAATKDVIEASLARQLAILERHLATRPFLLRPRAPRTVAWIARMLDPRAEGEFEAWDALRTTLLPLVRDEIGAVFLPWSVANARALAAGEKTFAVALDGVRFSQETQKYHAKSLGVLRGKYAALGARGRVDAMLAETGALGYLA